MNAPLRRRSDEEFQAFVMEQFQAGDRTMKMLAEQNKAVMLIVGRMEKDLAANTEISMKALQTAQKTAKDTESLVAFDKGAKRGLKIFAGGAEKIEKARKIVTPWVLFSAACIWVWHGLTGHGFTAASWRDILDLWK